MEQWIRIKGRLIYEPRREGIKKVQRDTPWWVIVQLPHDDLSNFYRRWLKNFYGIVSHPPVWGTHVTVLDGRVPVKPEFMGAWKKHHGETVEFEYSPYVEQHWKFFTLPVRSEFLHGVRKELGFDVEKSLHITFGRTG
jgi:hypothetical protein